jgi:hypothetical protein
LQFDSSGLLPLRLVGALLHQTGDIMSNKNNVPFYLQGDLFDACSCHSPCSCWVTDKEDDDVCESSRAYRIEKGTITGVDVSGLCVVILQRTPIPAQNSGWHKVILIDSRANQSQCDALFAFFTGKLPSDVFADLHELMGSRINVEHADIEFDFDEPFNIKKPFKIKVRNNRPFNSAKGKTTEVAPIVMTAEMQSFTGLDNQPIFLTHTKKSQANEPMYIGTNKIHSLQATKYNFDWSFTNRSAMITSFEFKQA